MRSSDVDLLLDFFFFNVSEEKVGHRNLTSTRQINMHGFTLFLFFSGLPAAVISIHNLTIIRAQDGIMLFCFPAKLLSHKRNLINNDLNCTQQEFVFCDRVLIMLPCIKKLKPKWTNISCSTWAVWSPHASYWGLVFISCSLASFSFNLRIVWVSIFRLWIGLFI